MTARHLHPSRRPGPGAAVAAALSLLALGGAAATDAEASTGSIIDGVTLEHTGIHCYDRDGTPNHGGDMAFHGRRMVLACGADNSDLTDDGFVVLDITHAEPRLLGRFTCVASASDIALWDDLVFLAVDSNNDTLPTGQQPDGNGIPRPLFQGPAKAAPQPGVPDHEVDTCDAPVVADDGEGSVFKGLRIVSIADPAVPQLLASIDLPDEPGRTRVSDHNPFDADHPVSQALSEVNDRTVSVHNITLRPLPDADGEVRRVRLYLNDPEGGLNHSLDVPLDDPTQSVLDNQWRPTAGEDGTTNTNAGTGCHDLAVLEQRGLGACSRLRGGTAVIDLATGVSLGDIVGPRDPVLVKPENRDLYAHHSGAFSYDGETLFLSDEALPSLALGRCARQGDPALGAVWAFSTRAEQGKLPYRGHVLPPPVSDTDFCSSKQFNVIPMNDGRDVLVVAWTGGGTSVVEWDGERRRFETLATFVDRSGSRESWSGAWASHWYNGRIYVNNAHGCFFGDHTCVGPKNRGLDVLTLDRSLRIHKHAVHQKRYGFAMQECLPPVSRSDASAVCPPDPLATTAPAEPVDAASTAG